MNKKFITIEEQLSLLKTRGVNFNNEDIAKNVLLSKNYFDIINGFESLCYYLGYYLGHSNTALPHNA